MSLFDVGVVSLLSLMLQQYSVVVRCWCCIIVVVDVTTVVSLFDVGVVSLLSLMLQQYSIVVRCWCCIVVVVDVTTV